MEDDEINSVTAGQSPQFSTSGDVFRVNIYKFKVGPHGPFTLQYRDGEDTAERVRQDMAARVEQLRAVGVIKAH